MIVRSRKPQEKLPADVLSVSCTPTGGIDGTIDDLGTMARAVQSGLGKRPFHPSAEKVGFLVRAVFVDRANNVDRAGMLFLANWLSAFGVEIRVVCGGIYALEYRKHD